MILWTFVLSFFLLKKKKVNEVQYPWDCVPSDASNWLEELKSRKSPGGESKWPMSYGYIVIEDILICGRNDKFFDHPGICDKLTTRIFSGNCTQWLQQTAEATWLCDTRPAAGAYTSIHTPHWRIDWLFCLNTSLLLLLSNRCLRGYGCWRSCTPAHFLLIKRYE